MVADSKNKQLFMRSVHVKSGGLVNELVVYVKAQPSGSSWSSIQELVSTNQLPF
jgi:hypothetical protein